MSGNESFMLIFAFGNKSSWERIPWILRVALYMPKGNYCRKK